MIIRLLKNAGILLLLFLSMTLNFMLIPKGILFLDGWLYDLKSADEFSQQEWNENPYYRGDMVDDLLARYDFLTMTKEEVIELLGEERLQIDEKTLSYETGGGYFSDEILVFYFDANGKITDVGLAN